MKKNNYKKKICYISVPAQIINSVSSSSLHSFLNGKTSKTNKSNFFNLRNPMLWAFSLFLLSILGMVLRLGLCLSPFGFGDFCGYPYYESQLQSSDTNASPKSHSGTRFNTTQAEISNAKDRSLLKRVEKNETFGGESHLITSNIEQHDQNEFWKQPDGLGYKPCLDFSNEYRRESKKIVEERRKYLMVFVSEGLNQQKIQIVDAVVIARILGAVLVVPILQINLIWGDERYI